MEADLEARLDAAAEQWKLDGWALIEAAIDRGTVETALDELLAASADEAPPPSGPRRRADQHDGEVRFRPSQFDGTTLFPIRDAPLLNRLFVHPVLRRFCELALETDELRIYQSRVWSKYGGHTDYAQPLHRDGNHSLVPIRNGPGWGHVELFVYLHDVDPTNGAPMVVPGQATGVGGSGFRPPLSPDDAPDLYAAEVRAEGPAGSVFAYRSDVWHRGTDIDPGAERHIMVVAFRPAAVDWIGFDAHAPLVNSPDFVAFAERCTPKELALFGVPAPGHPFWTAEVLEAMAGVYPALDLSPWRAALDR